MNQFLRKALISSSRNSVFRTLAYAASGSGLLDASFKNLDSGVADVSLSISEALISLRPSSEFGNQPIYLSRVSPVPAADISKETSGFVGDAPKPCCGCLGRDTIANAAAKVGPAVVNLYVPQGMYLVSVFSSYVVIVILAFLG
ncbi:putative protease Do-like 14 isoform X1 [Mercurialis annua]|uniref:putative protease Do-like 14 isoform X1 n=1 Tax=Mercurialis annua TaxID=3986 RepID=UPI0024AE2ECC|nr:putative protease Do-like 14 isoform X1 [Mercurialis annua]